MDELLADAARKHARLDYSDDELRATVLKHVSALEKVATPRLVHWDAWNPNFFVGGQDQQDHRL